MNLRWCDGVSIGLAWANGFLVGARQIKHSHKWLCLGDAVSEQDVVAPLGADVWPSP